MPERVVERVMKRWDEDENGCWISRYAVGSHGYASVGWSNASVKGSELCHRVAWMAANPDEEIPDGFEVDHICRTRPCVRPDHLRLMTALENQRQGGGHHQRKPEPTGRLCANGHELLLYPSGATRCKECSRKRTQAKALKLRQERLSR